ncbi:MAG: hypothetical protein AMJ69_02250 [Gammaproteobacteria bacterium SG8_47]|nr:MAG: hypothetical protein AMJ69_02250 [Gammaproteobacteria bacterium SG8_47]
MFRTLSAKLALTLAAAFVLIGIFFVLLLGQVSERFQQEVAQKLNRDLAEHIVAERLLLRDGSIDRGALDDVFHMLMVINPTLELYLLDPGGRILAYSAPPGKVVREAVSMGPVERFLAGAEGLPILGDDPRGATRRNAFSVAPVVDNGQLQGYLYVILASEQYAGIAHMLQDSYVLKLSTGVLSAGLAFALLAALLAFMLLTRRLRRLAAAMQRFRQSEPRRAALRSPARGDEIDQLDAAFEDMSARIAEQMQQLKSNDDLRRELVANVSHDLRTPLASLHGYLETLLLKDSQLDAEDRRRYIDTALKHSRRLGRLVDELFELAKLDANEVRPHCEPFSLPDLVQDVVHKFQLRAEQDDIRLSYRFESDDIPFVNADIALIERVLDNLLDNALRHTPRGGDITVSLISQPDHVTVCVSDTGSGIAEQELSRIFDRFYQAGRGEGGAGLGLAITRRILELHGSVIKATSQLNAGTVFTFDLPAPGAH